MTEEGSQSGLIYEKYYKGSDRIDVGAYFNNFRDTIKNSSFHKHFQSQDELDMIRCIGRDVDREKFELLENYCSIDKLTVCGELEKIPNKNVYDWCKDPDDSLLGEEINLQTVHDTKQRNLLKNYQLHGKYKSEKPISYDQETETDSELLEPENDVLIYVRVYVPFTSRHKQSTGALGTLSVNYAIALHGSQTLDALKDKISCPSDHSISTEMSSNPVRQRTKNAKDVYKSGFFFIEDTFYNDSREPGNKDNSKVIREWASSKNYGTYKTAKMEETRIDSLILRFGYPWVYQHQGDCEHLICFSDARLVNPTDILNKTCYPQIVRIKPRPTRYCMTCGIYHVSWVMTSNDRLPHNPCLFCESCFKSYNYIDGEKIGSFQAYPYPYDCDLLPK
ncbi:hypothetical protein QAD02_007009 [Eretmocerus hayati]|uniref:Uncharacterized protein n=1 Tax=Eretmocerus hayati TaxID=131215 RepID=A0ACC2N2T5_9HYME|nr:hypothetical protein QAD02_007009 [Eretmocerus hayati]